MKLFLQVQLLAATAVAVAPRNSPANHFSDCQSACDRLLDLFPSALSIPGSAIYNAEQLYWSQQQSLTLPLCRLTPTSANDLAIAILILRRTSCPFAVKSGGHAAFAGASNIDCGITLDLSNLSTVSYSPASGTAVLGPGATWAAVYSALEPYNVAVLGGRVAAIGVGGLTLGGGISFFSGKYGYTCDGVKAFEVVLANGSVIQASRDKHPRLYRALRGGGSNFGVVTAMEVEAFAQGAMWGGPVTWAADKNETLFRVFEKFAVNVKEDPGAAMFLSLARVQGEYFIDAELTHDTPTVWPAIFDGFKGVEALEDGTKVTTLTQLTEDLNVDNPNGVRNTYTTMTFHNSAALQSKIFQIFQKYAEPLDGVPGILAPVIFQPITKDQATHFRDSGGNSLGIRVEDCPLTLMSLSFMWSNESDDAAVYAATAAIIRESEAASEEMGLAHPFVYQNYASAHQNVFAGYGETNWEFLKNVAREYDPDEVFQKLKAGYFKVSTGTV